jgi:curved DNA-binding protein CbpA
MEHESLFKPDPYEILGVARDSGIEDIEIRYRELVRRYLRKIDSPTLQERNEFHRICEAWDILRIRDTIASFEVQPRSGITSSLQRTQKSKDLAIRALSDKAPLRSSHSEGKLQSKSNQVGDERLMHHDSISIEEEGKTIEVKQKERDAFLAFAMELVDQEQADRRSQVDDPGAEVQGELEEHQILGATKNDQHESDRIEEEIEERNRAYRDMEKTARTLMPDLQEEGRESTKQKEMLYSVPVEQLNMQVMNPQQTDYCVDIVAVHGLGKFAPIRTARTAPLNFSQEQYRTLPGPRSLRA